MNLNISIYNINNLIQTIFFLDRCWLLDYSRIQYHDITSRPNPLLLNIERAILHILAEYKAIIKIYSNDWQGKKQVT